jgi:predicted nucleic acid-binding protein
MKPMTATEWVFVDSNIWLYAFIGGDQARSAAAAALVQRSPCAVSVQVINEVCVNLKRKAGLSEGDIQALIESFFARCLVVPLEKSTLLTASVLRDRYSLSYWDSTIVASALQCGATSLYTEDLQHGQTIEGPLRVVNPFVP